MQFNTIESLEWDSNFFEYPVAKIVLDHEGYDKLDSLIEQIKLNKLRLTYLFVAPTEKKINKYISKKGGLLVDQKVIFSKQTGKHGKRPKDIAELKGTEINEKLKRLALQAGLYSRFRTDKNFTNNEYKRLYLEWLDKSVIKEIAFKVFIAVRDTEIVGLTTLGNENNYADIGLVSVDENFRGLGIGGHLIQTADATAFDMGFDEIKVVTQLQNKSACRLYEKCNFHIESITNIYHYWQ